MTGRPPLQIVCIAPAPTDPLFEGIGAVNGGGATAVLLKDYPQQQRDEILDLVFTPKFGASVSTIMVEIPGDGNSTQGSMPSHQHTRDDLDGYRGYTWWLLREAKRRNPDLTLDAVAWSAPGWVGEGEFWSQDTADYYVSWLRLLREEHNLELDAIGCRNEKGVSLNFAKLLRATLDAHGFERVRLHGFDNWQADKFDFVRQLEDDREAAKAIDIIGAHVLYERPDEQTPSDVRRWAAAQGKPIWNTEDHVYKKGFDCLISIVECFNESYLLSGATRTVLWYDIAGVYPIEPYAEDPAMLLAHEPWSGHYVVREALWGYAHYGQFTELGWSYVNSASLALEAGGSLVTLRSPAGDFSLVAETKDADVVQRIRLEIDPSLSMAPLAVWRSDARTQFARQDDMIALDGVAEIVLHAGCVYTITTTKGQRKGGFDRIPSSEPFPFPYRETFEQYVDPAAAGYLPRFTADISGAFELTNSPDGGPCVQQVVPVPTISWAPDWRPNTILGDASWTDYEASVKVLLGDGESGGLMGRIDHVGSGFGFIPRCYYLELEATGKYRLVECNGKDNLGELVGDAEQRTLIAALEELNAGGERELAGGVATSPCAGRWVDLTLRFSGRRICALVDGRLVADVEDRRHTRGMVGLIAGAGAVLSTLRFNDLRVNAVGDAPCAPTQQVSAALYPLGTKASQAHGNVSTTAVGRL